MPMLKIWLPSLLGDSGGVGDQSGVGLDSVTSLLGPGMASGGGPEGLMGPGTRPGTGLTGMAAGCADCGRWESDLVLPLSDPSDAPFDGGSIAKSLLDI